MSDTEVNLPVAPYPEHLVERIDWAGIGPLVIRPLRESDLGMERRFIESLSPETLRARVMGAVTPEVIPEDILQRLVTFDYGRAVALAAVLLDDHMGRGEAEIIGVARIAPLEEAGAADFAVAIGDRWQRFGLGRGLLVRVIDVAAALGYRELRGSTLATNDAMQSLARGVGMSIEPDPDDWTLRVLALRLPPPGAEGRAAGARKGTAVRGARKAASAAGAVGAPRGGGKGSRAPRSRRTPAGRKAGRKGNGEPSTEGSTRRAAGTP